MAFPEQRMRRLRQSEEIRRLVRETSLSVDDFIAPLFIVEGKGIRRPISSLPGQFHFSPDTVSEEALELKKRGIGSILLFGIPSSKDDIGEVSCREDGVVQESIRALKRDVPDLCIMADLCFCEYTSHGHCGVIVDGDVDNDLTLIETQKQTLSLAKAGADVIAPSGMMDGMVGAIRECLDEEGLKQVVIMAYSAKYSSGYYGPFREAAGSAPSFGNRNTYQMDPANAEEALREIALDIEEGADIVMVKPALAYLDIIRRAKDTFEIPLAAYNVSGEYSMIRAAGEKGYIDEERVIMETLLSIKRAGADMIISYFSKDAAQLL